MIVLQSKHTQGTRPMKGKSRPFRLVVSGAGLFAALLPMAVGSATQAPLRWNAPAQTDATPSTAVPPSSELEIWRLIVAIASVTVVRSSGANECVRMNS